MNDLDRMFLYTEKKNMNIILDRALDDRMKWDYSPGQEWIVRTCSYLQVKDDSEITVSV